MNDGLHRVETEAIHGIDFLEPIYNVKDWSFALRRDVAITELVSSSLEKYYAPKRWWSLSGSNR